MSSGEDSIEATADTQSPRNLIRSQYKDIMVKVDEDIYYLDRLQLALKSEYFEKLFTEDFCERNSDLIEIPLIDTNTFSDIVDIIYGKQLHSVVKSDNFVSVLMAMDYLQMNIDEETYRHLVTRWLRSDDSYFNKDVFRLYDFITQNTNYEYLLPAALEHLSLHFEYLRDSVEFLSIPIHHFIEIISQDGESFVHERYLQHEFCRICAKWFRHDMENRLPRIIDVVNKVRYRFDFSSEISPDDLYVKFLSNDKHMTEDKLSRHLYALIVYSGEICCNINDDTSEAESSESDVSTSKKNQDDYATECSECCSESDDESESISQDQFSFSGEPKLEKFLKNGLLYDITLKIGEKVYKLHRSVLKSKSSYFEEIFSTEYSEITAQHEEKPPPPPGKDKVYFLPDDIIDSTVFDWVIDYIYFEKKEFSSDVIVGVFKALYVLKIDGLLESCADWMKDNSKDMCSEDVLEIINFTHTLVDYEYLNQFFSPKYIIDSWPKVDHSSALFADFFDKVFLPVKTDCDGNEVRYLFDEIDKKTFEWIIHHIYDDEEEVELTDENVASILRASELLKMDSLMEECVNSLIPTEQRIGSTSSKDVIEVLKFARKNIEHKALDALYLARHMTEWPRVDDSLFYCISFESLENLLSSPYFFLDDPREILDMCSKWVIHDIENRYEYVPGIAFAISRNFRMVCDNYSFAIPSDFSHCSQDFVKNELWKVLSSTSVLPLAILCDNEKSNRTVEQPVFIISEDGGKFIIFNAECEEMISFYLCKNVPNKSTYHLDCKYPMSSCTINDNLYILCSMNRTTYFHVFNISSRKLYFLTSDSRNYRIRRTYTSDYSDDITDELFQYTLLNCCNEIYCCLENGEIFKYSFDFNRWARFSKPELDKDEICYTSDGNKLYRMCNVENDDTVDYTLQVYNFQENSWVSIVNSRLTCSSLNPKPPNTRNRARYELIFVDDYGFLALFTFKRQLFLFGNESQTWKNVGLPSTDGWRDTMAIGQNQGGEILYVFGDRLYHRFPSDQDFVLKVPRSATEEKLSKFKYTNNENLVIIHNPKTHM
ncbi:uncharacterized protein LOC135849170 isoform X2 [Planococcus citri]|uniref:uncharacterized protein LOC135849170 isoform X2 n=1 Tax=Planococcus citri TaxID=170843 RepID=UPI0031F81F57